MQTDQGAPQSTPYLHALLECYEVYWIYGDLRDAWITRYLIADEIGFTLEQRNAVTWLN